MLIRRPSIAIAIALVASLGLASCGGSDDGSSDDPAAPEETGNEPSDSGEPTGDDDDPAPEPDETESDPDGGSGSSSLSVTATIPVAGGLGETIALSPDGSRLAHFEGGLEAPITVYDTATGDVVATGNTSGQGLGLLFTADDQLVSWDPGPLSDTAPAIFVVDATTLEVQPPITPTYPTGEANCGALSGFPFDAGQNAAFAIQGTDGGSMVCRLDLATNEVRTTIVPTTGPIAGLLLSADGNQLFVNDGGALTTQPATVFVLDSTTLDQVDTLGLSGSAFAVSTGGLVVPVDNFSDQLLDTGTALPAKVVGAVGPYLLGDQGGEFVVMNGSDGTIIGSVGAGFPIEARSTTDGGVLAIRTPDAISVIQF